mgnify:CR=1 FL=1
MDQGKAAVRQAGWNKQLTISPEISFSYRFNNHDTEWFSFVQLPAGRRIAAYILLPLMFFLPLCECFIGNRWKRIAGTGGEAVTMAPGTKKCCPVEWAALNKKSKVDYFRGSFRVPFHTFLPCSLFSRYMIPTKIKKNGPVKPNKATNLVP